MAIFWFISDLDTIKTECAGTAFHFNIFYLKKNQLYGLCKNLPYLGYIYMRGVTRFLHKVCATVHSPAGLDPVWIKLFTCASDILRLTNLIFEYC